MKRELRRCRGGDQGNEGCAMKFTKCCECNCWIDGTCRRHAPSPTVFPPAVEETVYDRALGYYSEMWIAWPKTESEDGCFEGRTIRGER